VRHPHQFDADIVQILAPRLGAARSPALRDFARLFVSADADGWALHDAVRRRFFRSG
jgi:hypothetical protein